MQIDKNKLKYIKPLNWKDVFEIWRKNESYENKWEAHYKGRGFNSWEEWRKTYTEPLGLDELSWSLFEIKNPLKIIPEFRGGPFHSWSKYFYLGESHPTFRTLIEHPGIRFHKGVRDLLDDFPTETIITGVKTKSGIVILEGMHRCFALALANAENRKIATTVKIALAEYRNKKMPILGGRNKK